MPSLSLSRISARLQSLVLTDSDKFLSSFPPSIFSEPALVLRLPLADMSLPLPPIEPTKAISPRLASGVGIALLGLKAFMTLSIVVLPTFSRAIFAIHFGESKPLLSEPSALSFVEPLSVSISKRATFMLVPVPDIDVEMFMVFASFASSGTTAAKSGRYTWLCSISASYCSDGNIDLLSLAS